MKYNKQKKEKVKEEAMVRGLHSVLTAEVVDFFFRLFICLCPLSVWLQNTLTSTCLQENTTFFLPLPDC